MEQGEGGGGGGGEGRGVNCDIFRFVQISVRICCELPRFVAVEVELTDEVFNISKAKTEQPVICGFPEKSLLSTSMAMILGQRHSAPALRALRYLALPPLHPLHPRHQPYPRLLQPLHLHPTRTLAAMASANMMSQVSSLWCQPQQPQ